MPKDKIQPYPPVVDYDVLFNVVCIAEDVSRQQRIISQKETLKHFLKEDIEQHPNDKDLGAFIRATYG